MTKICFKQKTREQKRARKQKEEEGYGEERERETMNELKSNKIFKTKKVPEERRPFRNLPLKARSKIMKIWVEVVAVGMGRNG